MNLSDGLSVPFPPNECTHFEHLTDSSGFPGQMAFRGRKHSEESVISDSY